MPLTRWLMHVDAPRLTDFSSERKPVVVSSDSFDSRGVATELLRARGPVEDASENLDTHRR